MRALLALALMVGGSAASTPPNEDAPTPSSEAAPAVARVVAGDVRVTVAVRPERVAIGQPLHWEVTVEAPAAIAVAAPVIDPDLPPAVEVRTPFAMGEERAADDVTHRRFVAELAVFALGPVTLPPASLLLLGPDASRDVAVPPVAVEVASVLPPGPPPPLRDPRGLLVRAAGGRWWPAALLAIVPVLIASWWLLRRRRPVERAVATESLPADERALRALRALARGPEAATSSEEFNVRLAAIVRGYIAERFALDALEMTTSELRESLADRPIDARVRELIAEIVAAADLVKFALRRPPPAVDRRSLEAAFELVTTTRLVEPGSAAGAGGG